MGTRFEWAKDTETELIWIPGNIPSLKNSKPNGKFHPKTVQKWLQFLGVKSFSSRRRTYENYKTRPNKFEALTDEFLALKSKVTSRPLFIGFHFVRSSRRRYDFHNTDQILFDLMSAHRWIEDDDTLEAYGVPLVIGDEFQHYDKNNPGCYITILSEEQVAEYKELVK